MLHRHLPTLPQWLGILLLLILTTAGWRTAMVASDGDTCMHWRVGEWMLQHRQLITHDVFSHTRFHAPVISKEWLSQIIFAIAGRLAGLTGLAWIAAVVLAATFALLYRQLLRAGHDLFVSTGIILVVLWAASSHWLARPHLFSLLLMVLWCDSLRRERWLRLPALMLLWVNLHGGFLAAFLVLAAYWLGAALEKNWTRLRILTLTGTLCGLASLINPHGYRQHWHSVQFLQSKFLTGWLAEYASSDFHSAGALGFLTLLAIIFLTLALARPRISTTDAVLLLSWTYFALHSSRNIPLLAIVSAPILAGAIPARWPEFSRRTLNTSNAGNGWIAIALTLVLVSVPLRTTVIPADTWPVQAVEYIRQHPHKFSGPMFNQYAWGGYLMWALPEHRTFVDGRTDFFGEDLIREFSDTTALQTNWTEALTKYDVQWTLMPQTHRLNLALKDWSCVYSDSVATIRSRSP